MFGRVPGRRAKLVTLRNKELHELVKSEDFAMIAAAIEQYRGCGSDLRAEWTSLVAHHDGLLDIARRSLQAMSSVSTRVLGSWVGVQASFTPCLIPNRVPHEFTPRS